MDIAVSTDPSNIGKLIFAQIMILQLDGTFCTSIKQMIISSRCLKMVVLHLIFKDAAVEVLEDKQF